MLLALSAGGISMAPAWSATPLPLPEAEVLALREEPGRESLTARAEELRESAVAAGQLPDPQLRAGILSFPLEAGGFRTEAMTQAQIGVRQAFPPGQTRAWRTRELESLARDLTAQANGRARDVLTAVRQAWLDVYNWEQSELIVGETRPLFSDLVTITRSLYTVGARDQQDLLRAELELSRLDDRLLDIQKRIQRARASLAQWVGVADAARPLRGGLPSWDSVPELALMRNELVRHPLLIAANARIEAREAGVGVAEQRYKPGWALDLSYAYRDGRLPNGDPRSDFVTLLFTFDVPLLPANRQDRALAAAQSVRRAAVYSKTELERLYLQRLESEYRRWEELNDRIALYDRLILGQAEEQARAALLAYQSDVGDFVDVMRGYITELEVRLDYLRLGVDRAKSYAVLANLGGL